MIRLSLLTLLAGALLGCAAVSPSSQVTHGVTFELPEGAIVLRVQVVSVEYTDLFPGCGETPVGSDCIPFYVWYRYKARVKQAVIGEWSQPTVEFTHLQHALFIDEVTRDCYVVLRPAQGDVLTKVGVPFVADKLLSRFYESHRPIIRNLHHGA